MPFRIFWVKAFSVSLFIDHILAFLLLSCGTILHAYLAKRNARSNNPDSITLARIVHCLKRGPLPKIPFSTAATITTPPPKAAIENYNSLPSL